jgi:multidrug resistance efflux pump
MSKKIKNFSDLKDSKLLFDKKVPAFGYTLIIIVSVLLVGIVIWSIFTPKTYMIKATGVVTNDDGNYVMSAFGGVITDSKMQEGLLVKEGDPLFCINSTEYSVQYKQLIETRVEYQNRVEDYKKLIQSLKDDKNYFDASKANDSLYYNIFETYKAQVKQNKIDASIYKSYGYTDEQIKIEIAKNQAKIAEIYHSTMQTTENAIAEYNLQITTIDAQLAALQVGKSEYEITASATGILHLLADYKDGMVVQAGAAVATITPENDEIIVEAYVTPSDRTRINEGDNVEIAVLGLPQSVYGKMGGSVIEIENNVTPQQGENGNINVFKIKVKPNSAHLISKSGEKVDLLNGMEVEARVQYDKVTYFNYVMEKLGFW